MGAIGRVLGVFARGTEQAGRYECLDCRSRFEVRYQVCPNCRGYRLERSEWVDGD